MDGSDHSPTSRPEHLARRRWTSPARSQRRRLRRWIHGELEKLVCHFSIHGDQPVFATEQFSWIRETLENPTTLRENGRVIAGVDRVHGHQAVRFW